MAKSKDNKGDYKENNKEKTAKISLREDLAREKKRVEELTDTLKRIQAEFENYKKRADKEQEINKERYKASLIQQFIPVLDTFDNALRQAKEEEEIKDLMMIQGQMLQIMKANGVEPFESKGKEFSTDLHEAMMVEEADTDKEIVTEEFQKGYRINGKILRHSKVKVGKPGKHDKKDIKKI